MPAGSGDSMASESCRACLHRLKKAASGKWVGTSYTIAADIACHNPMATEWAEKERHKRAAPDLMRLALDALVDAFKRL